MESSYRFFFNSGCEFFPCHQTDIEEFNCLFCFCPLYYLSCPGEAVYIPYNGHMLKDCSPCDLPHRPENYDAIIQILMEVNRSGQGV